MLFLRMEAEQVSHLSAARELLLPDQLLMESCCPSPVARDRQLTGYGLLLERHQILGRLACISTSI